MVISMIKKVFLLFLAVVVSVATSCSKDDASKPLPQQPAQKVTPQPPPAEDVPEQESFANDGVLGDDFEIWEESRLSDENLAIKPPTPTDSELSLDEQEIEQSFPPSISLEELEHPKNEPDFAIQDETLPSEIQQEFPESLSVPFVEIEPIQEPPTQPSPPVAKSSQPLPKESLVVDLVDPVNYWKNGGTIWDAVFVGDRQVGFQSSEFSAQRIQGLPVKRMVVKNQINAAHLERPLELAAAHSTFETLDGDLIGCQSKIKNGHIMYEQNAKVFNNELELETKLAENTNKRKIPWKSSGKIGGNCTIQISLYKQPLQDREERRLSFFDPSRQSIVNAVLAARKIEPVDVFGTQYNLQRIDAVLQSRLDQVPCTFWTDRIGSIIKMSTPFTEGETLTSFRSNRKNIETFEIESSLIGIERMPVIPLSNAIVNQNAMDEITYIVTIKGDLTPQVDPSALFPNTRNQKILPVGRNTVRITVRSQVAKSPDPILGAITENSLYTKYDVDPNFWVNSDDPAIIQISNAAVAAAPDLSVWSKATALERWVFDNTKWKPNAGFLTASEVAYNQEADSIGYGVLLTALARTQNIPTRVVVGLIYVNEELTEDSQFQGTLAFHLWNEMLIENQWIPFDATYGLGGASAARIKVADSDLETTSFVSIASEVLRLAGNLDVEIDSATMLE